MDSVDVRRGVCRWLVQAGYAPIAEVALGNGRRADLLAVDMAGRVTLVEIKVSRADLRGDRKWPEYLDWCDRFYWAVPTDFNGSLFDDPIFRPAETGLVMADRYGAAELRPAPILTLNAARRRVQTLRMARVAALRLVLATDPEAMAMGDYL
ncbi:MmcB family DNA repair protein [Polymorphobacter sp.]|uniref:MmcB family DNA repair protein n=1 Tax=Polymorphobacter sp. TaxID=1909290 RepID=UPI003F72F45B